MKIHKFFVALLGLVFACGAFAIDSYAATVSDDNEEWEDWDEELTSAEAYYRSLGREHPLFDVVDGYDYQAMVDSANVVLALFPYDIFSLTHRSRAYFSLGENEKCLQDALKIYCEPHDHPFPSRIVQYFAAIDPAMVKRNLGRYTDYYLAQPDPALAESCTSPYLLLLADVDIKLNNRIEAFNVAKIAANIVTADHTALIIMASLLMQNGDSEEAINLLKPYVDDLESVSLSVFYNYILALRDNGKSEEAYTLYDKVLDYDLDTEMRWRLLSDYACLYAANGDYGKALPMFDSLVGEIETVYEEPEMAAYFTNLPELYLRRGIIYSILGDKEKAKYDLTKALSFTNDEDDYQGYEATAYAWLGDRENALKWVEIYNNDALDSTPIFPVYAILGETEAAIRDLKHNFDNHLTSPDQIEYDPNYIHLRATPEYKELVKSFKPLLLK